MLSFIRSEFRYFDDIDVHGVGVTSLGGGGRGEGVVHEVGRFLVAAEDLFHSFPLGLEMDGAVVPFINGGRDSVHGHDSFHEWGGNTG